MHNATTALETLEFLRNNLLTLSEQVDLESMPPEAIEEHARNNAPVRPFRIAAWLARQGYFISAWTLWEYYSRSLCSRQTHQKSKRGGESTVEWIGRSLSANAKSFTDQAWFASANCVRNLIAHNGGHVVGSRANRHLQRALVAFPDLDTWQDGYLALKHEHTAELQIKIEDFIRETA